VQTRLLHAALSTAGCRRRARASVTRAWTDERAQASGTDDREQTRSASLCIGIIACFRNELSPLRRCLMCGRSPSRACLLRVLLPATLWRSQGDCTLLVPDKSYDFEKV